MSTTQYVYFFGHYVSQDAIVQTWGTLIGAALGSALAALTAFSVARYQIGKARRDESINGIKEFLKTYHNFKVYTEAIYSNASVMNRIVIEVRNLQDTKWALENLEITKKLHKVMELNIIPLRTLNHSLIPIEVYVNFTSSLRYSEIALKEADQFVASEGDTNQRGRDFFNYLSEWNHDIQCIVRFADSQDRILKAGGNGLGARIFKFLRP